MAGRLDGDGNSCRCPTLIGGGAGRLQQFGQGGVGSDGKVDHPVLGIPTIADACFGSLVFGLLAFLVGNAVGTPGATTVLTTFPDDQAIAGISFDLPGSSRSRLSGSHAATEPWSRPRTAGEVVSEADLARLIVGSIPAGCDAVGLTPGMRSL